MSLAIEALVEAATGPPGLVLIFVYSVLVAFVLPLPGELVLLPAPQMELGVSPALSIGVVILVSAAGKAVGSLAAFRIGRGAASARPAQWLLDRLTPGHGEPQRGGPLMAFVRRYEYPGLVALLSVPLMPDTVVIYAFSILSADDERRLFLAAFFGTIGRLLVTLALVTGALAVV
ncbi:hypothetical protein HALDL1_08380 [Halobacterium sp. DL1]|jgi:membrane protein DedA with SNARE-associated domain|nr:hypothetical protein HALDL1_08380 [Halobacterium sp. DL1]